MQKAHASVLGDAVLVGDVAATVCSSLGMPSTNATLGRRVVSLALSTLAGSDDDGSGAGGFAKFAVSAGDYGSLPQDLLNEVYTKVQKRRALALAPLLSGGSAGGGAGSSHSTTASVSGGRLMAPRLKGGLVKGSSSSSLTARKGSLLGLDRRKAANDGGDGGDGGGGADGTDDGLRTAAYVAGG